MTLDSQDPDRSPLRFIPDEPPAPTLHPADAAALDAALDAGASAVPPGDDAADAPVDPARRQRVDQWLAVLAAYRVAQPPADLVGRTVAAVEADQASRAATRLQQQERLRGRGMRIGQQFGEFAAMAVAATLLITVLIPGLGAARQNAKRVACASNMGVLRNAFETYAADSSDALPSLAQPADGNWLPRDIADVREGRAAGHSNTANLLPLVRERLVNKQCLICPAHIMASADFDPNLDEIPDTVRGYSYLNLFTTNGAPIHHTWDHSATTIVLADRNPLFSDPRCSDPRANSFNHGQRGTNILAADGSVQWVTSPNVGPNNDNIWTVSQDNDSTAAYIGTELPVRPDDLFVSP